MENVELPGQKKDTDYLSLVLNILIIVLGIILIILTMKYGFTDCDKLRFDWKGDRLNAGQFMEVYSDECLDKNDKAQSFLNTSLNFNSR